MKGNLMKKRTAALLLVMTLLFTFSFAEIGFAAEDEQNTERVLAITLKANSFRCDGKLITPGRIIEGVSVDEPGKTIVLKPVEGQDADEFFAQYFVFEFYNGKGQAVDAPQKAGAYTMTVRGREDSEYAGLRAVADFSIVEITAPKVEIISFERVFPYMRVKWESKPCDGYEVQYWKSSDSKVKTTVTIADPNVSQRTFKKFKDGVKYSVRVRSFVLDGGSEVYGKWCKSKKAKSVTTGWKTVDKGTAKERKYYYRNGALVKGQQDIKGIPYYFNSKGEVKGVTSKMWKNVSKAPNKTGYYLSVDTKRNRFCIYTWSGSEWLVKTSWICSTGKKSTPTVKGTFSVLDRKSHFGENKNYSCWYATRFYKDYYIHSEKYKAGSKTKFVDGTMGKNVSEGCVRLQIKMAKWIYDNMKVGTGIYIY